jgi:hypothetical protein
MLLLAAAAIAIAFGSVSLGLPGVAEVGCTTAGACARCGDGVCAKSCESATSCPKDCGGGSGVPSAR